MASAIDLTQSSPDSESDQDEDLKLAIAMSLAEHKAPSPVAPAPGPKSEDFNTRSTSNSINLLDRRAMEAERLARLKRKRDDVTISPPPLSRRAKSPPVQRTSNVHPVSVRSKPTSMTITAASTASTPPPKTTLEYPNGAILRTALPSHHPQTARDITFSQLISATTLQSCLLSSFTYDFDWLFPHFETKTTSFLLVLHSASPHHESQLRSDFATIPNVRLCFPITGAGCMHSKLMLLFYPGKCRIVVPTANLMAYDWGEMPGVGMENMLFVLDLPLLPNEDRSSSSSEQRHPFHVSLVRFLTAQDVPRDVLRRLATFDFAATKRNNISFVHSIAGSHVEERWRETGIAGLGLAVSSTGLSPVRGEAVDVDFITSSVGSLDESFMRAVYLACLGDDGAMELSLRMQSAKEKKMVKTKKIASFFTRRDGADSQSDSDSDSSPTGLRISSSQAEAWRANFRFFFHSRQAVAESIGGSDSAGTICFQRRWWADKTKFPRANMRECVSVRKGVLMHSKVLFVRYKQQGNREWRQELEEKAGRGKDRRGREEREYVGWVYVGSANLSESAWGRLVVDRGRKNGVKLTCRNWECGVVVPVPVPSSGDEKQGLDVFDGVMTVPIEYPGRSYEEGNGLEPWFFGKKSIAGRSEEEF